nr:MAG TPA: hypothetical protein [Caudoviricetes sp.]
MMVPTMVNLTFWAAFVAVMIAAFAPAGAM